jgi:hypothetical protein
MATPNTPTDQPLGAVGSVTQWLTHPFRTDGSALNWLLFTGLILCAIFFWTRVLAHISRDIGEV